MHGQRASSLTQRAGRGRTKPHNSLFVTQRAARAWCCGNPHVHVDPMPHGACQTFILLHATDVHTMVYDTSTISREDVAQALCATAEQLKCPRWQELVAHWKDLLAAGL